MPAPNINSSNIVSNVSIEPLSIDASMSETVRANVNDALWFLAQQFRVGEFTGDDAGSLVKARIATQSVKLNRYRGLDGVVKPLDETVPLEVTAEKQPLSYDLGTRLEWGNVWYGLVMKIINAQADTITINSAFQAAFPFDTVDSSDPEKRSNTPAMQVRALVTTRMTDGVRLYNYFKTGGNAVDIISGYPALATAQDQFMDWVAETYAIPAATEDNWAPRQLEYQLDVSAPLAPTANAAQNVLQADKYRSGNMDWYSFDLDNDSNAGLHEASGVAISNADAFLPESTYSYIPRNIEFKGMPKERWWEFEDRNIDLSRFLTQKQDVSKMVVTEFGLIYSNDWFLIPHVVQDNTITSVNALVTTDVFGRQFLIRRAGSAVEQDWWRWDMYNVSRRQEDPLTEETFGKLLLIPHVSNRLEGNATEQVLFLRDEMANMVWGVEEVVPNELAGGMDGKNAYNELSKYLAANSTPATDPDYIANSATIRYRMQTSVPENWIPFIARQMPASAAYEGRTVLVQRATMRRYINGDVTDELIHPRTSILSYGVDQSQPYYINEEEVSRSGFVIGTNFQRARWYNGATFTWLGRKVTAGRGEGNSGFKFDTLVDKEADA